MAKTKDMTKGNALLGIAAFALPLMIGNVFQQLYTVVDTRIVGKGIGVDALAALGAGDWFNWMFIGLLSGLTQGFSILYSQLFGARDYRTLRQGITSGVRAGAMISIAMAVGIQFLIVPVLRLLQTPDTILPSAAIYLRIMMGGAPIVMAYNLESGILRALGDGRTPLVAMGFASAINIGLDLLFVMVFHWGIPGAAVATLIAQVCASLYCFVGLRRIPELGMCREDWKCRPDLIKEILRLGLPLALQQILISVGGMIVQQVVNGCGVLFIAGFTAVNKLYGVLEMAAVSFGYAIMTFTGQNLGAGQKQRILHGIRQGALLSIVTSLVICGLIFLFGVPVLSLFISGTPEECEKALEVAWLYLRIMAVTLPTLYVLYSYRSALQGIGNTKIPLISGAVEFVMRVGAALLLPRLIGENGVLFAESCAWIGAAVLLFASWEVTASKMKREEKLHLQ